VATQYAVTLDLGNLSGPDGNALSIVAKAKSALSQLGESRQEIDNFISEALSGDYDHVIETVRSRFHYVTWTGYSLGEDSGDEWDDDDE